jgi:hypothetical protein
LNGKLLGQIRSEKVSFFFFVADLLWQEALGHSSRARAAAESGGGGGSSRTEDIILVWRCLVPVDASACVFHVISRTCWRTIRRKLMPVATWKLLFLES